MREQRVPRAAGRLAVVGADERALVRVDRVRAGDAGGRGLRRQAPAHHLVGGQALVALPELRDERGVDGQRQQRGHVDEAPREVGLELRLQPAVEQQADGGLRQRGERQHDEEEVPQRRAAQESGHRL